MNFIIFHFIFNFGGKSEELFFLNNLLTKGVPSKLLMIICAQ